MCFLYVLIVSNILTNEFYLSKKIINCLFVGQGEIASAFGDLLKKLWAPGATPVAPRTFKLKLAHFAPQFSGFNQHDSQVCSIFSYT